MSSRRELEQGRDAFADEAWLVAHDALTRADEVERLGAEDLELLARSAYLLGRDDGYVSALERAHDAHLDAGDLPAAARCTVWIGHSLLFRGETARATGWFARGERLLDDHGRECVERGYLLIPVWLKQMGSDDLEAGYATAGRAAEIGDRFGDEDLLWLARHDQGRALLNLGRVDEGLRIVDEALVIASADKLSPVVTGIVFCNTISFCRDAFELGHVKEWSGALTQWCERQPEMVAHNGICFVHRAEISLLEGDLEAAMEDARSSAERFTEGILNQIVRGRAHYIQGETHRLRGDFVSADGAYREANRHGFEPQPGFALMRLAQGNVDSAAATIRRAVAETTDPLPRAELLPAYVEIMLTADNLDSARAAAGELEQIAAERHNDVLTARACHAAGAVALAQGAPSDALISLRQALRVWHALGVRYEAARVRALIAAACRAVGDEDTAALEFEAARMTFDEVGAVLDRARVDALDRGAAPPDDDHGLTARELEVLRLVAAGRTNREVADELVISDRTVARHVQNIFAKLGVSSRTEAAAFAFWHGLV